MAVNLTWHSFMEQVWGIRLRCRTNSTCCETSELRLFRTQFWLVREPAAAIHKRHFAAHTERLRQLGQRSDKCQPHTWEWGWKTQRQVSFLRTGGDKRSPTSCCNSPCWHYDICFAKTPCEVCMCSVVGHVWRLATATALGQTTRIPKIILDMRKAATMNS